jgi:hypothetical protein
MASRVLVSLWSCCVTPHLEIQILLGHQGMKYLTTRGNKGFLTDRLPTQ